jgi:hypothetical protein
MSRAPKVHHKGQVLGWPVGSVVVTEDRRIVTPCQRAAAPPTAKAAPTKGPHAVSGVSS